LDFARGAVAPLARTIRRRSSASTRVEAAVLKPFDEGLKTEGSLFIRIIEHSGVQGHCDTRFFAIRAAAKIPDVPSSTPLRAIKSVAVIGAGTMGGGIAMNLPMPASQSRCSRRLRRRSTRA